jgi:O-antigen ligase
MIGTVPVWLREFIADRIQINSLLIVLCFVSVLALSSQSAASYPSYLLAVSMALTWRHWNDVVGATLFWMVVAVLGYLCASALWSETETGRRLFGILSRSLLVFFFVVAMAECQLRGAVQRWLGRALAVVGALAAAAAILWFEVEPNRYGRLFGLGQLDNPVVAALIFGAVTVLILQMLFVETDRRWLVVALASLSVVVVAVYLTGSRNSWFSAGCAAGVLILAHRVKDRQRFVASVVAVLLLFSVAILAMVVNEDTREWVLPRGDSFRVDIWSYVIDKTWEEARWFGFGILTPDHVPVGDREFAHPHNMYLAVFFQGGLVGLFLFLTLTVSTLMVLMKEYQLPSAKLALGLLTLALISYLLDGHELVDKVGETWFLYWLPVGLAVGMEWNQFFEDSD